jgi:hypothetical protein
VKRAAADHYLRCVVPEARGLKAAALEGAATLYGVSDEALGAY